MKFSGCGVKKYESGNENENCPTNAFNFDLQVAAALLKVKWLGYFQYAGGVICTCMLVWYRFPQVQTGYAPRRAAAAVQKTWLHPAGKMKQCLIKKKTTAQKVPPLLLSPETSERKSRVNDHRDIQLTDRQAIRLNFYARWNIQKVLNFV